MTETRIAADRLSRNVAYSLVICLAVAVSASCAARGADDTGSTPLPDAWREASISKLADLIEEQDKVDNTPGAKQIGAQGRDDFWNAVSASAWDRFLSHPDSFGDYPRSALLIVTHRVASRLDPVQKAAVLRVLQKEIIDNADALKSLSPADFYNLDRSLVKLNAGEPSINEAAAKWLESNVQRIDDCDPRTLALLLPILESDPDSSHLIDAVMSVVWTKYLSDPDFFAEAKIDAINLSSKAAAHLSPEQRLQIRSALTFGCLYSPETVAELDSQSVGSLCEILKIYGFTDFEISGFVIRWHGISQKWKAADPVALSHLVSQLKYGRVDDADAATTDFCNALYSDFLTQPAFLRQEDSDDLSWIVRDAGLCFTPDQKQSLAKQLYKFVFVEHGRGLRPTLRDISTVGKMMEHANLDTEGTVYPEYAEATSAALGHGDYIGDHPYWDPKFVSIGLCSPSARDKVMEELKDDSGIVRLDVVRVVGFAFQRANQIQNWESYLDDQINESQGDERAAWLLGRGYCAEIETAEWDSLKGQKWVQQAIQAAATDEMRAVCTIWSSQRLCYKYKYAPAIAAIRRGLATVAKENPQKDLNRELLRVERLQRGNIIGRARRGRNWEVQQLTLRADELEKWIASQRSLGKTEQELQLAETACEAMKKRIADARIDG